MLKNYLKFTWRRLMSDKRTSFINLFGLTVGLVGFLLIVQYVFYEKSYDQFQAKKDRIYRVAVEIYRDNKLNIRSAINYAGVGPALKEELPEVEKYVRMARMGSMVEIGTNHFRENDMFFADSTFFEIFSVPLFENRLTPWFLNPGMRFETTNRSNAGCTKTKILIINKFISIYTK